LGLEPAVPWFDSMPIPLRHQCCIYYELWNVFKLKVSNSYTEDDGSRPAWASIILLLQKKNTRKLYIPVFKRISLTKSKNSYCSVFILKIENEFGVARTCIPWVKKAKFCLCTTIKKSTY